MINATATVDRQSVPNKVRHWPRVRPIDHWSILRMTEKSYHLFGHPIDIQLIFQPYAT
jgi:hypothetical protein